MFRLFKKALNKTKEAIKSVVGSEKKENIDRDLLEEALIEADIDYDLVEKILNNLPKEVTKEKLRKELDKIFENLSQKYRLY